VGLFSRAAVGFPIGTRLKSKTPHEGAGFIERPPITETPVAVAQPIAHPCPTSIGINRPGRCRDVVGFFSRAAVGFPIGARLKSKTPHKDAGLVETTPIADTTAIAKPIGPTVPPGIGITTIGRCRDVNGLFPRAAIGVPCLARLEPEPPRKGSRILEGAPIADTTAIAKPIGPTA